MTDERKSRLAALATRAGRNTEDDINHERYDSLSQLQSGEKKVIQFRNYGPIDSTLDQSETMAEHITKKMRHDMKEENDPSQSELEKALSEAKEENSSSHAASKFQKELDATPASLRKVNWDLKRDISKKLQKLERRTQKAIVELLRERLDREAEIESDGDLD